LVVNSEARISPLSGWIRYNVVAVSGVVSAPGHNVNRVVQLGARFTDNGPHARVVLHLTQLNLLTGAKTTLQTLDSDGFASSADPQTQSASACAEPLDFQNDAYYIEAALTKTEADGNPILFAVQLKPCSIL